jgi:hypothetical protein
LIPKSRNGIHSYKAARIQASLPFIPLGAMEAIDNNGFLGDCQHKSGLRRTLQIPFLDSQLQGILRFITTPGLSKQRRVGVD